MRTSQAGRAGYLAERERWLRSVQVDGREELLFELEMLLRGLERYFHLHNVAVDARERPLVTRDFHEELEDVRDALDHAIRLVRQLLDPDSDSRLVFREYVKRQLADDRVRRVFLEEELEQDTPQEALFVLRQAFDALRTIVTHLLKLPACPLALFEDVGNLALREVLLNPFFRPFRPLEFRIEYDRIRSVRVLELLASLPEDERPLLGTTFLALFRLLHYLSYVGPGHAAPPPPSKSNGHATPTQPLPRRARVVLALVRSEAVSLVAFLRTEVAPHISTRRHKGAAVRAVRDIGREADRIARSVLPELERDPHAPLDAAIAFTKLFRAQVVALSDALTPGAPVTKDVDQLALRFDELVDSQEMAHRLRKDLWVFSQLCRAAESALRKDDAQRSDDALEALRAYQGYFQDVSYQLLRYGDFEPFDRFTALLTELPWPPQGPGIRLRLAEDLLVFGGVLEGTFHAVSRRALLKDRSFDRKDAEALKALFLSPA